MWPSLSYLIVSPPFTLRSFLSKSFFHFLNFPGNNSSFSATSIPMGTFFLNSQDRAPNTMMNNNGLRMEPWCTPTRILHSFWPLSLHPHTLLVSLYVYHCIFHSQRSRHLPFYFLRHSVKCFLQIHKSFPRHPVKCFLQIHKCFPRHPVKCFLQSHKSYPGILLSLLHAR